MLIKNKNSLRFSVITLGVSALMTQIILLREFLSVFYGNELVIGIILTNWMLLTGLGAYLGKFFEKIKNRIGTIIVMLLFISILPLITVFLLSLLRNFIFPVGGMISLLQILISSFVLLFPYCLLSGLLFTILCIQISAENKNNSIRHVYALEAIGSIIGGLLFNFILIYLFRTFQSLLILMIINLIATLYLSITQKKLYIKFIVFILSVSFISITLQFDLDSISKELLFKDQTLVFQKDTPYGNLVVTETGEQKNFFENGILLCSTDNVTANEEAVHYSMVQHPDPKNILLVSGGFSGVIAEILKYNVDNIDYVELNPWLIKLGEKYINDLNNKKLNIINRDARLFIKECEDLYDVVLINLPDPTTAQLNRYYTIEFFKELKEILNKDAIISTGLMATENYLSNEERKINSVLYKTLKTVFKNVLIVPGGRNFYLASDKTLGLEIVSKIEKKNIDNVYVNQYYLDEDLLKERSNFILDALDEDALVNRDFSPIAYYQQLLFWLSYFEFKYWIPGLIFIILLIILLSRLNPINLGLFAVGFSASSIEIIILIAFQIIYGYIYQMTGIIITLFMAGLAIGALFMHKFIKVSIDNFIKIQFGLAAYSIVLPFIFFGLTLINIPSWLIHLIFFLITIDIAIIVGMQFSFGTQLQPKKISSVASGSYSSDMLGSAVGALLTCALLIPLIGLLNIGIVIGILNIIVGIIIFIQRKKYLSLY